MAMHVEMHAAREAFDAFEERAEQTLSADICHGRSNPLNTDADCCEMTGSPFQGQSEHARE